MPSLIPALLVQDEKTFLERVKLIEGAVPLAQIDVMDGSFVPNRTWYDEKVVRSLPTDLRFELHLMVKNPAAYIEEAKDNPQIVRFIWHIEAEIDHGALISRAHEIGKEAGLAVSPNTPLDRLVPFAEQVQEVLVMGGEPGFSGQRIQLPTVERVKEIKQRWPDIAIGFDIGVNGETIPLLVQAGAERLCAAGAIFKAEDPRGEIGELSKLM